MNNDEKYQVKYWAGNNDFDKIEAKKPRSIKRKLFIVFSFLTILILIPVLIFGLSNTSYNNSNKISTITSPLPNQTTNNQPIPVTITEPTSAKIIQTEVLANDNYWKITKRVCDSGKYYLSVKDQNSGKALYQGDNVNVTCVL